MAATEWARRGAVAGFDEGVRVRGLVDATARRLALAGLETTVTDPAELEEKWFQFGVD